MVSIMKIKALAKLKPEEGIWMTEVDKPELGYNDLLIRIKKTAICGTDVLHNKSQNLVQPGRKPNPTNGPLCTKKDIKIM